MKELIDMFPLILLGVLFCIIIAIWVIELFSPIFGIKNSPLSSFYLYSNLEGFYASKQEILQTIDEICIRNIYHVVLCTNDEMIKKVVLVNDSRTLYLTETEIILWGNKIRPGYFTYLKYLSFIRGLKDGTILATSDFHEKFRKAMK